ncbi:MAG: ABC transporter ATP-binding protein [Bacteroidota bacterium]
MNAIEIRQRFTELRQLIQAKDLSRATRRVLDFFTDFYLPAELKRNAISLRAAYNEWVRSGPEENLAEQENALLQQCAQLLDAIELELETPENVPVHKDAHGLFRAAEKVEGVQVVVEATGITKTFRTPLHTFRLPPLDISLKVGEIPGVVGENGNGKTTLLRMVAGDLQADGGELGYPGFDVPEGDWYQIKQHIAFIPQALSPWQGYLKENLHFTAAIHGIKGQANEDRVEFIIHRLGLTRYSDSLWKEISSGYKLRFELARALVWKPQLLIIDEPLANLDINTQQMFLQDLRYLADSLTEPIAILLTSQHLHEVESIADNIIFMREGRALYNGSMQEFGQNRKENLFEVVADVSASEIQDVLKDLNGLEIEDQGRITLVRVAADVPPAQVLGALAQAGISPQYFRDISTSTLKLFREHAQKD